MRFYLKQPKYTFVLKRIYGMMNTDSKSLILKKIKLRETKCGRRIQNLRISNKRTTRISIFSCEYNYCINTEQTDSE